MLKENKLLIQSIVIATVSFMVALYFQKIWLALFLALITAVAFIGRLLSMSKSTLPNKASYRFIYSLFVIMVVFHAISFAHNYGRKDFQKDLLLNIRKTIEKGISKAEIQQKLVYVLQIYHTQEKESIVETAKEIMPENFSGDGIYVTELEIREADKSGEKTDDNMNHFYTIDEQQDEIRVYAVSDIALGENPNYKNYDGQIGRFEIMFVLNKGGVDYEILN